MFHPTEMFEDVRALSVIGFDRVIVSASDVIAVVAAIANGVGGGGGHMILNRVWKIWIWIWILNALIWWWSGDCGSNRVSQVIWSANGFGSIAYPHRLYCHGWCCDRACHCHCHCHW